MQNITLSNYQQNIINHVATSNNNLIVNALAGSGKTFTLVLAVLEYLKNHPRAKVAMSAFNKSIADELNNKIKDVRVLCRTSHSIGLLAIRNYLKLNGGNLPLVINDKYYHYKVLYNISDYSEIIDEETENKIKFDFISNVDQLLNLCRVNLIKANEVERITDLAKEFNITPIADEVHVVRVLLRDAYEMRIEKNVKEIKGRSSKVHPKAYVIDYVDMLTFGATHAKWCTKYDLFCGDECQDFNKAQHELIFNSLNKDGKIVVIGDPHQAINGFAGAMNDSFEQLASHCEMLPLSVNYRCGKSIIAKAQEIVMDIMAHENACEGEVIYSNDLKGVKDGDFILCRTKAPLVRVAMKFLRVGRTANVLGMDLASNLKSLIRQAVGTSKASVNLSTTILMDKLNELKDKTQNDILNRGYKGNIVNHPTMIELADKIECIDNISLECTNIAETFEKIDVLFTAERKANSITLMTCHKSKGLENDNVHIILPNKLPLTWDGQLDWQYQQEKNLEYVAYTRAKKCLNIIEGDYEALAQMDVE